ncbi:MAG: hypothetical protein WCA17_04190 [Burkholderiales bacterium]
MNRTRRIALLLSLGALAALAGCAVSTVAKGRPGQDLSGIAPGASRAKVESIVGAPKREWTTASGVRYRMYRYDAGVAPSASDASAVAFLDVATLGLSEAIWGNQQTLLGPSREAWLGVSYDAEDRAIGVFRDITEFENLPEDGRAPPSR